MKSLESRYKSTLKEAKKLEKKGRHFKAAELMLQASFYGDDVQAYEALMGRGQILESIGFNAVGSYGAAYENAMWRPMFSEAITAVRALAGAHSRRMHPTTSKVLMREAEDVLWVFENEYGWAGKPLEQARRAVAEASDHYDSLLRPAHRGLEDTLTPGELMIDVLPGAGLA